MFLLDSSSDELELSSPLDDSSEESDTDYVPYGEMLLEIEAEGLGDFDGYP